MASITNAVECKIGAAARIGRRCTEKYTEVEPQPISRFGANSLYAKGRLGRACRKGGA